MTTPPMTSDIPPRAAAALSARCRLLEMKMAPNDTATLAGNFVEGDVECLFFFLGKFHHNTVHFGNAHVLQNLKPLMTANHPSGGFVPDNRLDITELFNGAFQLFVFGIARFQILSRVIFGGDQPLNREFL